MKAAAFALLVALAAGGCAVRPSPAAPAPAEAEAAATRSRAAEAHDPVAAALAPVGAGTLRMLDRLAWIGGGLAALGALWCAAALALRLGGWQGGVALAVGGLGMVGCSVFMAEFPGLCAAGAVIVFLGVAAALAWAFIRLARTTGALDVVAGAIEDAPADVQTDIKGRIGRSGRGDEVKTQVTPLKRRRRRRLAEILIAPGGGPCPN